MPPDRLIEASLALTEATKALTAASDVIAKQKEPRTPTALSMVACALSLYALITVKTDQPEAKQFRATMVYKVDYLSGFMQDVFKSTEEYNRSRKEAQRP